MVKRQSITVRIARPKDRPYQLWYRDEQGRQIRISAKTRDEEEAERLRAELEAKLVLGVPMTEDRQLAGPHMDWEEFRRRYSDKLMVGRSRSIESAESRLDIAERIIQPRTLGDMANQEALRTLQRKLLTGECSRYGRPRSTMTVKGYMGAIKAALNWAVECGWLESIKRIESIEVHTDDFMKGRPLVGEELDRMMAVTESVVGARAAASWRFVIRGVASSGLRLGELMKISWDIPQTIQPVWRKGRLPVLWFPGYCQKNGKTQEIPLCPWFEELLDGVVPELRTGWVFEPMSLQYLRKRKFVGERLGVDRVGKVIAKIGKRAGIVVDEGDPRTGAPKKYASCHDLRRTFAQRLADSNLPPELACRLMRHADVRTTQRYYQVENVQRDAGKIREILICATADDQGGAHDDRAVAVKCLKDLHVDSSTLPDRRDPETVLHG